MPCLVHVPKWPLGHLLRTIFWWALHPSLSCLLRDQGHCRCQVCSLSVSSGPCEGLGGLLTDSGLSVGLPEPDNLSKGGLSSHLIDEATEETGRRLTHPYSHPKSRLMTATLSFQLRSNPYTYFLTQDVPGYTLSPVHTYKCGFLNTTISKFMGYFRTGVYTSLPKTPTQP